MKKKLISLILVMSMVLSMSISVTSLAEEEAGGTSAESGYIDLLNVGTSEELGYLQWGSTTSSNGACFRLIYDPVFYFDAETNAIASDVLEDWYYEDDGFTLVMKLKENIYFSNGEHATGDDLLYSYTSNADEDRNSVYLTSYYGKIDFDNCYVGDDGYSVYIVSDGTVTMASQEGNLIMQPLMCKSWCEEVGWDSDEWYSGPVGSGPYAVSDYRTDNYYVFDLRDDYWNSEAVFPAKEIRYTSYSEASTLYMDLESGAIDLAIAIDSNDYERAQTEDGIGTETMSGDVCSWIVFDEEDSVFSDINVRKAVAHAVKWDEVASAGKGTLWHEADSSIPSNFPDYTPVGQYEYDPDYAAECLAEAGYEPGDLDLYMIFSSTGTASNSGVVMQQYLEAIGINLTFDTYELSTVIQKRNEGEGDLDQYAMSGGSLARSAYTIYSDLRSDGRVKNLATISDPTIDELLDAAGLAATTEEAAEYYAELQQYIFDDYRLISYLENEDACAFNTDVISAANIQSRKYVDLVDIEYVQQP